MRYHRRCVWFCGASRATTPATPLELLPGASAYFAFDKYRCDGPTKRYATSVHVRLDEPVAVPLRLYSLVGWCGRGDPGSTIELSPYERTANAAAKRG